MYDEEIIKLQDEIDLIIEERDKSLRLKKVKVK